MQDTHTIETPISKKKVVLKGWITGREADELNNAMFEGVMVGQEDADSPEKIKIPASKSITQKQKKIQIYVVSVDGNTERAADKVMDMNEQDTAFVSEQIDEIIKKKSE